MSRIVMDQFAAHWATLRKPRSLLGSVGALAIALIVLVLGLAILLVAAVVAVPIGLVLGAVWWVRQRLPRRRSDGRRNVRVRVVDGNR